jgi:hypothetical protein
MTMSQDQPRFWHVRSHRNHHIVETYCLVCFKFVGASNIAFNLKLVESAHRVICHLHKATNQVRTGT